MMNVFQSTKDLSCHLSVKDTPVQRQLRLQQPAPMEICFYYKLIENPQKKDEKIIQITLDMEK